MATHRLLAMNVVPMLPISDIIFGNRALEEEEGYLYEADYVNKS